MISATLAPSRRWRMSITCRSRRASPGVVVESVIGNAVMGAEKSIVLNFQQKAAKVKTSLQPTGFNNSMNAG